MMRLYKLPEVHRGGRGGGGFVGLYSLALTDHEDYWSEDNGSKGCFDGPRSCEQGQFGFGCEATETYFEQFLCWSSTWRNLT